MSEMILSPEEEKLIQQYRLLGNEEKKWIRQALQYASASEPEIKKEQPSYAYMSRCMPSAKKVRQITTAYWSYRPPQGSDLAHGTLVN